MHQSVRPDGREDQKDSQHRRGCLRGPLAAVCLWNSGQYSRCSSPKIMKRQFLKVLALLAVSIGIGGCAILESIIPAGLPTATYAFLKANPQARGYVIELANGISAFSSNKGDALSPDNLRLALVNVPINGLPPIVVSGIYDVVIVAYTPIYNKYVAGSSNVEQVRVVLSSIAAGLTTGVAAFDKDYPLSVARTAVAIPQADLRQLADSIAKSIQ